MKKKIVVSIILIVSLITSYTNSVFASEKSDMQDKLDELQLEIIQYCENTDYSKATEQELLDFMQSTMNEYQKLSNEYYNKYNKYYSTAFHSEFTNYIYEINEAIKSKQNNSSSGGGTTSGGATGGGTTLEEIIKEGQGFISAGEQADEKISQDDLQKISNTIYNILLVLGIVIAVILGGILGIKFITEGVEGQADVKKALVPYIIGCVVVFGSFAIWKMVVDVLQSM